MNGQMRGLSAQQHYRRGEECLVAAEAFGEDPAAVKAILAAQAHFAAAIAQMAIYSDTQISKVPL